MPITDFKKLPAKIKLAIAIAFVLLIFYAFCLPFPLFDSPTSTIVYSSNGNLMGAHIADDGQWRFKSENELPERIRKSILVFEDRRFFYHHGIDIYRIFKAFGQNIRHKSFVSGASTISMQVIRLSKKNPARNIFNKILEIVMATRLELQYSKKEIILYYASNAPFGGNVVGFEAASWRYFGLPPDQLSWAQAATLAVLPNSPALIHPGNNRKILLKKRDRLLKNIYALHVIDKTQYELALTEDIPPQPFPLPESAPHLTDMINIREKGNQVVTSISEELQAQVQNIVRIHQNSNESNEIFNCAVIVVKNDNGEVLSYIGNTEDELKLHDNYVDMVMANRSGGSILKPLLFVSAFEEGLISLKQLLPDIPVNIDGFTPENFNLKYCGAVRASEALSQSLNVPAVVLLKNYGISKFISRLRDFGLTTIVKDADYYGLPLILGSPDVRLWELAGVYSSFAKTLKNYNMSGKYYENDFNLPVYSNNIKKLKSKELNYAPVINAGSIYQLFEILTEVRRPDEEGDWEEFQSARKIAWKTGTSYGLKDAWSIGVSGDYTVGVWVGNSNGKGRPRLVGAKLAAPIMFEVFSKLPMDKWFETPYDDMRQVVLCSESGYLLSDSCEKPDTVMISAKNNNLPVCEFHKKILTDPTGEYLVDENCQTPQNSLLSPRFVLPPTQEYYFRVKNPSYKGMPTNRMPCNSENTSYVKSMEFIYPNKFTRVIIPKDYDGKKGKVIFKLAHHDPDASVYWHIDNKYIKSTTEFHNIEVLIEPGMHLLSATDQNGNQIFRKFEVLY